LISILPYKGTAQTMRCLFCYQNVAVPVPVPTHQIAWDRKHPLKKLVLQQKVRMLFLLSQPPQNPGTARNVGIPIKGRCLSQLTPSQVKSLHICLMWEVLCICVVPFEDLPGTWDSTPTFPLHCNEKYLSQVKNLSRTPGTGNVQGFLVETVSG